MIWPRWHDRPLLGTRRWHCTAAYPVREHYIVYEPLGPRFIVAVIRQGRDIPAILQKWAAPVRRELIEIRGKIERGENPNPFAKRAAAATSEEVTRGARAVR
jgi:hypothetical protein